MLLVFPKVQGFSTLWKRATKAATYHHWNFLPFLSLFSVKKVLYHLGPWASNCTQVDRRTSLPWLKNDLNLAAWEVDAFFYRINGFDKRPTSLGKWMATWDLNFFFVMSSLQVFFFLDLGTRSCLVSSALSCFVFRCRRQQANGRAERNFLSCFQVNKSWCLFRLFVMLF